MKKVLLLIISLVVFSSIMSLKASAATLDLVGNRETYPVGTNFNLDIKINSEGEGVNGAQGTIQFDNSILEALSVDRSNSIFDFWLAEPTISNANGRISFVAASTTGYTGQSLQVLRVVFKPKGAARTTLVFSDAAITAADGSGNNVLTKTNGLSINIVAGAGTVEVGRPEQIVRPPAPAAELPKMPDVVVPLYPDQAKWNNVSAKFLASWELPADITSVATLVDNNPNFDPTISQGLFETQSFSPLPDGIHYLHVRFRNKIGWGPTRHYKISIDTAPPARFEINIDEGDRTHVSSPTIRFKSADGLSGLSHYSIQVDSLEPATTAAEFFRLRDQLPGKHTIKVAAFDNAGNATEQSKNIEILFIEKPLFAIAGVNVGAVTFFSIVIGLLLGAYMTGLFIERSRRRQVDRRILIAKRDVNVALDIIKKDISEAIKRNAGPETSAKPSEVEYFLNKMQDNLSKMKKYLGENIDEIGD